MSYADKMWPGGRYRVTFMAGGNTTPRAAVMKFLGTTTSGDMQFDLRPLAGTQTLRQKDIVSIHESDEKINLPKPAAKDMRKIEP